MFYNTRLVQRQSTYDHYLLQREAAFISRFLSGTAKPCRILDVCCGCGSVTRSFSNAGVQFIGLDINPVVLTVYVQRTERAKAIQGDAVDLPFVDGSFDYVVGINCFDQLDRTRFLSESNRVLSQRGILIFDAVNHDSYKVVLKRLYRVLMLHGNGGTSDKWIDTASCDGVLHLIRECGLEIHAICGYSWPPFTKTSNSMLVDLMAHVEHLLQLDRYHRRSPRILLAARKSYPELS